MKNLFYRPKNAWLGDVIPFYQDGQFRLYYLHERRNKEQYGEGMSWYEVRTHDFVHFEECGEALAHGSINDQDLHCYTGCVIEAGGKYHMFYTGHNPYPPFCENGEGLQCVMHAVSDDLEKWTKLPEDTFYADGDLYERHDWRDPFVFWNEEANEYWMLLASRLKTGPSRRRGCIALCASKDLSRWEIREPFWAPGLYITHECPDLFKIGDWWYLVYSEFSERFVTRYRMSKSLQGPWIAPKYDAFDGRAFYAAKTWSDGKLRYAFGWNPSKELENDYNEWQWAGNLVVHEVIQESDGTLSVKVPESFDSCFNQKLPFEFSSCLGEWNIEGNTLTVNRPDQFSCAMADIMPKCCKISATMQYQSNTKGFGIMLRASDDFENAYYIRLEPDRNRLVFDMWPRRVKGEAQWHVAGDRPYMEELETPIELTPQTDYVIKVFVDDSLCVVYVDDKVAMTARLYNLKLGRWGVFVNEGEVSFENVQIMGIIL